MSKTVKVKMKTAGSVSLDGLKQTKYQAGDVLEVPEYLLNSLQCEPVKAEQAAPQNKAQTAPEQPQAKPETSEAKPEETQATKPEADKKTKTKAAAKKKSPAKRR